jgi:hypothetical protein
MRHRMWFQMQPPELPFATAGDTEHDHMRCQCNRMRCHELEPGLLLFLLQIDYLAV